MFLIPLPFWSPLEAASWWLITDPTSLYALVSCYIGKVSHWQLVADPANVVIYMRPYWVDYDQFILRVLNFILICWLILDFKSEFWFNRYYNICWIAIVFSPELNVDKFWIVFSDFWKVGFGSKCYLYFYL